MPLSWELPLFIFIFDLWKYQLTDRSRNLFMRPPSSYDVYFWRESNGHFRFLLGHSTLVREIFHIMCTDAFLVFQAHSSGHILMGVILPRILFKCRSYSSLESPLSLYMTSFLPPPSERPSLPKQSPPAQSAHAPLTAVAISTVHRSAHITPAGTHPSPFALPSLAKGCAQSSRTRF